MRRKVKFAKNSFFLQKILTLCSKPLFVCYCNGKSLVQPINCFFDKNCCRRMVICCCSSCSSSSWCSNRRVTALNLSISNDKSKKVLKWTMERNTRCSSSCSCCSCCCSSSGPRAEVVFLGKKGIDPLCFIVIRSAKCNPLTVGLMKTVANTWSCAAAAAAAAASQLQQELQLQQQP